jgi:hypothetical protein
MMDIISQVDFMNLPTGRFVIRPQTEWEVRARQCLGFIEYESWQAAEEDLEKIQQLAAQLYRDWLMLEPIKDMGEVWARICTLTPGTQTEIRISTNILGYKELYELYQRLIGSGFNVTAVEGCYTCPEHDWAEVDKLQPPHQMLIYKPASEKPCTFECSYQKYPHL